MWHSGFNWVSNSKLNFFETLNMNWSSHLILNQSPVPIATLFSPAVPISPLPPTIRTNIIPTCPHCNAASTVFSNDRCQFCQSILKPNNSNDVSPSPVVDYYQTSSTNSIRRKQISATIFVIDGTATRAELYKLKVAIVKEMKTATYLESESLIGVVVCGAAVSVYELGGGTITKSTATADVYPGQGRLNKEEHSLLATHEKGAIYGASEATYLAPSFVCLDHVEAVLTALPGMSHPGQSRRNNRRDALRKRKLRRKKKNKKKNTKKEGAATNQTNRNTNRHRTNNKNRDTNEKKTTDLDPNIDTDDENENVPVAPCPPKRCILKATEVALALMKIHHCHNGHVIICTSGGETERRDAVALGRSAALSNVRIDIMTFTHEKLRIKRLQGLICKRTDGLLTHTSIVEEEIRFQKNLRAALNRCKHATQRKPLGTSLEMKNTTGTKMATTFTSTSTSSSSIPSIPSTPPISSTSTTSDNMKDGIMRMTVRTSLGLRLTRCIGPITTSNRWTQKHTGTTNSNMSSLHWGVEEDEKTTHFTITSQAIDSSIALYFELLSNEITTPTATTTSSTNTYVYVQFIVHNCWKEEVQDYVTRVITHRLTLAKDVQSHLKSMNPQTTAVAIVKRAVLLGSPSTTDTNDLEDTYVTFATTHRGNGAVDDGDHDNGILRNNTIDADDTDDIDIEEEEEEEEEKRKKQMVSTCTLLDQSLQRLAQWFYVSMGGASKMTTFSHELMEVARTVYNTKRLLNNIVGKHSDDLLLFTSRVLSSDLMLSEQMLSPTLYGVKVTEIMQLRQQHERTKEEKSARSTSTPIPSSLSILHLMRPVPLSTLSMSSDMMLVLHSSNEIHIWSGGLVAGIEYDALRNELSNDIDVTLIQRNACPIPKKIVSFENNSEARSLYSLLEPSHVDPEFVQLKRHGVLLGGLNTMQLKTLRGKLLPTDELTLHGYVASLFKR